MYPCLIDLIDRITPASSTMRARARLGRVLHKSGRNSGARKGRRARGAEKFARARTGGKLPSSLICVGYTSMYLQSAQPFLQPLARSHVSSGLRSRF